MTKQEEYISLREEIISVIEIQNNYVIAMYTITVAILGLAIQQKNEWLFLLPYIILFSFQRIISAKKDVMIRLGAYIAVFLDDDFGWEKYYPDIFKETTNKHNDKDSFSKLMNVISGRLASLQLGVVCSVGCVAMCIINGINEWKEYSNILTDLPVSDVIPIFISILLLAMLQEWCKGALNAMQRREQYIESLESYKRKLEDDKVDRTEPHKSSNK